MTDAQSLRRLLRLVSTVVLVDTLFFAVVAPLLPHYAHDLHLGKAGAGILTGAYAAGTLVGAVPSGILAARAGGRIAILTGLTLLAVTSVAFGFLHTPVLLDLARFAQGLGGACTWAGGLSWLIEAAPADRRGELIGRALGAAIAGEVLGPAVGALAVATSTRLVFSSVVLVAGGLAIWVLRTPPPVARGELAAPPSGSARAALVRPDVVRAAALGAIAAAGFGVISVLAPLRLSALGAGSGLIALTFLLVAAAEGIVAPIAGRRSDRSGRFGATRPALVASVVLLPALVLPGRVALLIPLLVIAVATLGVFWPPAMAELADASDAAGVPAAYAFALANLAWAAGQVIGAAGGGALAAGTRDLVPLVVAAALCLLMRVALNGSVQREGPPGTPRTMVE